MRGGLESLKSCADYAALADYGDALMLALTDGVSRHGAASRRGLGFRPLFIGLANLSGALRFRSGNHALAMDGREPEPGDRKAGGKANAAGLFHTSPAG